MKTKALFNHWSIILSLWFISWFLIDPSAQAQDLSQISNFISITYQSDTVNIGNKDVLLDKSPMLFFPDYNKLFNNGTEVIIMITEVWREKGYSVNFIVKDSILFLKHVTQLSSWGINSPDQKVTSNDYLKKVSEKENKERLEKMTGRKFDKNGLLKADWVSGEFYGGVDGKFNRSFYSSKTYYKIFFEKGFLKQLIVFEDKRPG